MRERALIEVTTGSRLHFGLLELASEQPLRFGGLGVMLDEPGWVLRCSILQDADADDLGEDPEIARRLELVSEGVRGGSLGHRYKIEVVRTMALHAGLGAGTQLAAAAAAGLLLCESASSPDLALPSLDEIVRASARGKRSGIGLYGFVHGGFILDEGHKHPAEEGPRQIHATSVLLHPDWRVVLITPKQQGGITGGLESGLMEQLGMVPNPHRQRMFELAVRAVEVASQGNEFDAFVEALQEYVDLAGELFAAVQGGRYNGPRVEAAAEAARRLGLRAVGQSSWGPTVFGFAESEQAAEVIAEQLARCNPDERWQIRVCTPARQGAKVVRVTHEAG